MQQTEHALSNTVALSTMLQGLSISLIEAAKESKVVISVLREERSDQTVWSELFERAKEFAAGCKIEPILPKISAIQRNNNNNNTLLKIDSNRGVTEPTYLPFHHSSASTEPSTCPLLLILFKSSMTGCSTTMTGSWVNTSYLRSSDNFSKFLRCRYQLWTVPPPIKHSFFCPINKYAGKQL